jgi:hypothetical protein
LNHDASIIWPRDEVQRAGPSGTWREPSTSDGPSFILGMIGSASSGVAVLLVFEMGQLRHALVQDTWLPEVVAGWRPHRVLV